MALEKEIAVSQSIFGLEEISRSQNDEKVYAVFSYKIAQFIGNRSARKNRVLLN